MQIHTDANVHVFRADFIKFFAMKNRNHKECARPVSFCVRFPHDRISCSSVIWARARIATVRALLHLDELLCRQPVGRVEAHTSRSCFISLLVPPLRSSDNGVRLNGWAPVGPVASRFHPLSNAVHVIASHARVRPAKMCPPRIFASAGILVFPPGFVQKVQHGFVSYCASDECVIGFLRHVECVSARKEARMLICGGGGLGLINYCTVHNPRAAANPQRCAH